MNYWKKRAEELLETSEFIEEEYLKELEQYYINAIRRIEVRVLEYYRKFGDKHEMSTKQAQTLLNPVGLKTFHQEMAHYYSEVTRLGLGDDYYFYLRKLSGQGYVAREREMFGQLWEELRKLSDNQTKLLTTSLETTFRESYYYTTYTVQSGLEIGVRFNKLSTKLIEETIKKPWIGSHYSDRIWADKIRLTKVLHEEVTRGIIDGENSIVIARRLRDRLSSNTYNAERLARTEINHILNQARGRAMQEQGVPGYIYDATLDMKTCEDCARLDGQRFTWAEKEDGVNYPPLHPHTRSTVTPDIELNEDAKRIARGKDGKTYFVPHDMNYKNWYKKYINDEFEPYYYRRKRQTEYAKRKR